MGLYIDTPQGKEDAAMRRRRLALLSAYYEGAPYENEREWRSLLGYAYDAPRPAVVVNYPRLVAERPAHFAFDRVLGISQGDDAESGLLQTVVEKNGIYELLFDACVEASVKGDALLVFDVSGKDSDFTAKVRLIPAEDYVIETSPHDENEIELVRIEYKYVDGGGAEKWHREEISADGFFRYEGEARRGRPVWMGGAASIFGAPDETPKEWRLISAKKNRLGFIPAVQIKNRRRTGRVFGESDLDDLLTIFDDINWKLSQRSRNISRTMNAILLNINGRIVGGGAKEGEILSVIGDGARVEYLANGADMSEIGAHLNDLRRALAEISGVSLLDPEKLSGLGAISGFALSVLYEPLVALAERKRRTVGGAMEKLLAMILSAARHAGALPKTDGDSRVQFEYGPMFRASETELAAKEARIIAAMEAGVITKEDAKAKLSGM